MSLCGVVCAGLMLGGCGSTGKLRGALPQASASQAFDTLPLRDRVVESVAVLEPELRDASAVDAGDPGESAGDDEDRAGEAPASSGVSAAGLPVTVNAATVDGLTVMQSFRAGPRGSTMGGVRSGTAFGGSALRSLRVTPRTFSAEAAGAGAVLAAESRSGEAAVHGMAFGLVRDSAWAAANPFAVVTRYSVGRVTQSLAKPDDVMAQFGGRVGGPVSARVLPRALAGRVQAFGALEEQVRSNVVVSTPAVASFLALTPVQHALLSTRGVSAAQTDAALRYLDSLMGPSSRSSQRMLAVARVDAELGTKDTVNVSWMHTRFRAPAGGSADGVTPRGRGSVGDEELRVDAPSVAWQHVFSPRWSNELRVGVARDFEAEQARAPLPQEPAISPGGLAPQVAIGPNGFSYGTPSSLGRVAFPDERRVEVVEAVQRVLGRHVVRAGGDWSRVEDLVASEPDANGRYSYDSGVTGGHAGGIVDWITDYTFNVNTYPDAGCPSVAAAARTFCFRSFTQSFGQQRAEWTTHEVAAFAQDTWRVTDRLLLHAGARWEYTLLPLPQQPNAALDAMLRTLNDPRAGTTAVFPEDRNNFGPRVGAVWSSRVGTLRVGYGMFFGRLPGAMVRTALVNTALPASVRRVRIRPTTETACPQQPAAGFGFPCAFTAGEPPDVVASTSRATVFAGNFRLPAVQRASVEWEHSVGGRALVRVGYAGALATQLPGTVDLNIAPATAVAHYALQGGAGWPGLRAGQAFAVPLYTQRRFTQYGPVNAVVSAANASYHALNAGVRGEWRGVRLAAGYTFSRAIDYGPMLGATPQAMTQFDPFANGYDKGRSALDVTHRFAGSAVVETRWARGPEWQRRALGGWRIAAIGSAGSGHPYSYGVFGGPYLAGGRESLNGAGGATYLPSVGRNTLRLPARGDLDLRMGRAVHLGRAQVEGFAQAFNVLNQPAAARVETRAFLPGAATAGQPVPLVFQDAAAVAAEGINTPAFGAALSSAGGWSRERQVELGLRAEF